MKTILILAGILVFSRGLAAVPDLPVGDGPTSLDQVAFWTNHRLFNREYEAVDEALAKYANLEIRSRDGKPVLGGIEQGIILFAKAKALSPDAVGVIRAWRRRSPGSLTGILVESRLWLEAAWAARGPGFASNVSDEGWTLFHERLGISEKTLREGRAIASRTPVWYSFYMDATLGNRNPGLRVDEVFREGMRRFPDYFNLYFAYLMRRLPQWSGDDRAAGVEIAQIAREAKVNDASILYARLYWFVHSNARFSQDGWIFAFGANWPFMRKGFESLGKQYPQSYWNASNYLNFACMAADREAYRAVRDALGDQAMKYAGEVNMDVAMCDQKMRPMSEAQSHYEKAIDEMVGIHPELVRACFNEPTDEAGVINGFSRLLEKRRRVFEIQSREKPEEPSAGVPADGTLESIKRNDAYAICTALKFKPK